MNTAEIDRFLVRVAVFNRRGMGLDAAEMLADKLVIRDREEDDRRSCIECSNLQSNGRCAAAQAGKIPGADRLLEPVRSILQRCPGFTLARGQT